MTGADGSPRRTRTVRTLGPARDPSIGRHAAAPVLPALLNRAADVLDGDETVLAEPLAVERRRLRVAQEREARARTRLRVLRTTARRVGMVRWRRVLVTILGVGVGVAVFVIAVAAVLYLLPAPLLVVPAVLVLGAVVLVARRLRGGPELPVVGGLDAASAEVAAAATAVRRARSRLAARGRQLRADVALWCRRYDVPDDARALRRLARQDERRRRHARGAAVP